MASGDITGKVNIPTKKPVYIGSETESTTTTVNEEDREISVDVKESWVKGKIAEEGYIKESAVEENYVPYEGATKEINIGTQTLKGETDPEDEESIPANFLLDKDGLIVHEGSARRGQSSNLTASKLNFNHSSSTVSHSTEYSEDKITLEVNGPGGTTTKELSFPSKSGTFALEGDSPRVFHSEQPDSDNIESSIIQEANPGDSIIVDGMNYIVAKKDNENCYLFSTDMNSDAELGIESLVYNWTSGSWVYLTTNSYNLENCSKKYFVTGASVDECDFTDIDYDELQLGDVIVYTSNEDSTINYPYTVINKAEGTVILSGIIHTPDSFTGIVDYEILFLDNVPSGLAYSDDFSWQKVSNYDNGKRYLVTISNLTFELDHGSDWCYFPTISFITSTLPADGTSTALLDWLRQYFYDNRTRLLAELDTQGIFIFVSIGLTGSTYSVEGYTLAQQSSISHDIDAVEDGQVEAINLDTGERIDVFEI